MSVLVYCDSHPGKVSNLETFTLHGGEDGRVWVASYSVLARRPASDAGRSSALVPLEDPETGKVYARVRLECPRCGLSVPTHRQRLWARLDRLADGGVSEISLAAIAAMLR